MLAPLYELRSWVAMKDKFSRSKKLKTIIEAENKIDGYLRLGRLTKTSMSMCSRVTSMSSSRAERVILHQIQKNTPIKISAVNYERFFLCYDVYRWVTVGDVTSVISVVFTSSQLSASNGPAYFVHVFLQLFSSLDKGSLLFPQNLYPKLHLEHSNNNGLSCSSLFRTEVWSMGGIRMMTAPWQRQGLGWNPIFLGTLRGGRKEAEWMIET